MTDTFSFSRFGRLLATDLSSNVKKYSLWLGLVIGIIVAFIVIAIIGNYQLITDPRYRIHQLQVNRDPVASFMEVIFYMALFLTVAISAAQSMQNLAVKTSRINALMLPATQLEKFLSRWCIFVPIYLFAFLLGFQLLDWLRVGVELSIFRPEANIASLNVLSLVSKYVDEIPVTIWALMTIQSLYVLGSVIWPKNSMIITSCALFVIGVLITIFAIICGNAFLESGTSYSFGLSYKTSINIWWVIICVFTVINYLVAYYRYKEIEIIQRW